MPSECSPQSWSLLQTRGFPRAELCHVHQMGTPRGGLKLPTQPGCFPRAEPCLSLRHGAPPERLYPPGSDGGPPAQSTLPGPAPAGSEHLVSVAPSPERWWPGCAVYLSTSLTMPSSRTPSGTGPRRSGEQGVWRLCWSWGHAWATTSGCKAELQVHPLYSPRKVQ